MALSTTQVITFPVQVNDKVIHIHIKVVVQADHKPVELQEFIPFRGFEDTTFGQTHFDYPIAMQQNPGI